MAIVKRAVGQITLKVIRDIESLTYFYLLMPSIAPTPVKPTTNPPTVYELDGYSGWQTTEPSYTNGDTRSLYITVRTVYTDGSFDYSDPSLSSSYEAAKAAYNRAQSAFSLADDTNQYFWNLPEKYSEAVKAGAYVTSIPQRLFKPNPSGGNLVMQSTGLTIRDGTIELASLTGSALNFYNPQAGVNENSLQLSIGANGTLQSGNYVRGNDSKFATTGSKIDLTNGDIITTYFRVSQGLEPGLPAGAYIHGTVEATEGKIGADSTNYWEIGQYTDYNLTTNATMIGHGGSFIQLGDSSTWRLATNRLHTGWYSSGDTTLNYPTIDSKYWDFGIHAPTSATDKFVYIRSSKDTTSSSGILQRLLYDIDDTYATSQWNYQFYIDGSGNVHAPGFYIGDSTTPIGGGAGTTAQKIINSDNTYGKGSSTKPIYIDTSGYVQESNSTVGSGTKPIYLSSGTITASNSDIGNSTTPIYMTGGTLTALEYTIAKSVPSNAVFTDENVNTSQANTTKIYLTGTSTTGTSTGKLNFDSNVYLTTTAGTLHATTFEGNLSGTASRATADGDGNTIKTTYLKLSGGNVTGAVSFGSSVSADELTVGDLVVNGAASFTNNLQANTINGVEVGASPKFTDTTYTFTGGTNKFTVKPSNATAFDVTVTPSITNNVTGSGTSGYLAKFTGANTIGNGPALGSDTTKFLNNKGEWAVPAGTYTYTLPLAANGTRGGVQIGYTTSGKNYAVQLSSEKMYVNVPWENTTYSAGTGLSLSGTTFNHSNSITAGTAGTSSATNGATLAVPYITYDAQGHITATGTHTHTINSLSADVITGGYVNIHPENSPTLIPFIHNDIAHLLKRGGSVSATYDGNTVNYDFTNAFDGSGSYVSVSSSTYSTLVITVNLHKVFPWTNTIYIDFGAAAWRAKSIKIEVMNSNYTDDVWTQKYNTTNNGAGHVYVTFGHTPVGASNAGGGYNKIRFTLSNFNSTDRRIAQIGVYFYGSSGVRETYMSRGADDPIFRSITPYANNTYSLGSSSNKWSNVYATTLTGTLDGPVKDSGNGTNTTFAYSKAGLTTTSWLAAWNGYELRAISPSVVKGLLSLSKSDVGLGNVLNEAQITGIGSNNGKLRVYKGTNYEDVTVEIVATESTTATTATKLSSYAGTQYQPVYFPSSGTNQGKPVGITDSSGNAITIQKSVPADAVFTDTTYTAGSGLTLDGKQFKHSNSITAGTIADGGSTRTLGFGGTFKIPSITYDAQGHIKSTTTITLTMPAAPSSTDNATNDSDGNPINTTYIKKSIGTAAGDIIYWSASGTPVRLEAGNNGQVLKLANGIPSWATDNNTTYSLSGALSSHTFTTTLTPSSGSAATSTFTLAAGDNITLTDSGTTITIKATNTNTATAVDNILDGSNSGTAITYAPYTARADKLMFYTGTTAPNGTTRLNLNGYLYATKLYSNGKEVLTDHQSLSNYKTKQTAVTAPTAVTNKWVNTLAQNANGEITVSYTTLDTSGTWSGNAVTATSATTATTAGAFSSAASVTLTGDTTGSASSTKGWSITTKTDRISTVADNRTIATTPNDYSNKIIFQGLKNHSAIGAPSTDAYSYLVGLRGWSDSSGGNSHELAFNNTGIYHRSGATTSWSGWSRLLDSSNYSGYLNSAYVGLTGNEGILGTKIFGSGTSYGNVTNKTSYTEKANINYNATLDALVFTFA